MLNEVMLKNFHGKSMESDLAKLKPEKQEIAHQARRVVAQMLRPAGSEDIGAESGIGGKDVFEEGTTKGAPATLEFQFTTQERTFRYGVDILPGKVHAEYLFEEVDYVEELVFGRENNDVVLNEEDAEEGEDASPDVASDELLLASLDDERVAMAREWFLSEAE